MCQQVDLIYEVITSLEFWISFIVKQFMNEILKPKSMNIFKSVIVGVGTIVWSHTQIRLVGLIK